MIFGQLDVKLHSIYSFSNAMQPVWRNTDGEGDTVVLFDVSGSMRNQVPLCKLIASALKCCSGTQGKWNVPSPGGGTALVDAVNELHEMKIVGVAKVIIVTDGEDTKSRAEKLIKAVLSDGTSEFQEFRKNFSHLQTWMDSKYTSEQKAAMDEAEKQQIVSNFYEDRNSFYLSKCEAVATHISNLEMEMVVLAVGSEVKHFVNAMSKPGQRINVAHIQTGATTTEVVRQFTEVVRRPRRPSGNTAAAEPVTSETPTSALEDVDVAVANVEAEAGRTTVGEAPVATAYNAAKMVRYIDAIIEPYSVQFGQDQGQIREALLAYFNLAAQKGVIPGNLLHSRFGGFFQDPIDAGKRSKFATCINTCLRVLADKATLPLVAEHLSEFADDLAAGLVGPVLHAKGIQDSATKITVEEAGLCGGYVIDKPMFFTATGAPHYSINEKFQKIEFVDAAKSASWPVDKAVKTLVPWRGNTSEAAYNNKKEASSQIQVVGDGSNGANRKRSIAELEDENAELQNENAKLKAKLQRIAKIFDANEAQ
jgi:hypothetical protein